MAKFSLILLIGVALMMHFALMSAMPSPHPFADPEAMPEPEPEPEPQRGYGYNCFDHYGLLCLLG